MSIYNDILRRPHLPRELSIRNLLANTGIDLTQFGSSSREFEDDEGNNNDDDVVEECFESECEENDPCY